MTEGRLFGLSLSETNGRIYDIQANFEADGIFWDSKDPVTRLLLTLAVPRTLSYS